MSNENIYPNITFDSPYGVTKPSLLIKESDKIPYHLNSSGGYEDFSKPDKNGKSANEIALYSGPKWNEVIPTNINQKYHNKYYYIPMYFSDHNDFVNSDVCGNSRYAISHWYSFKLRPDGKIDYPNGDKGCNPVLQYSSTILCNSPVGAKEKKNKWYCNNVYNKNYGYIITNSFHEKNVSNLSLEGYAILYELCNGKDEFRISQLKCTNPAMKGCLENMNSNFYIIGRVPALRSEFINLHLDNYKNTESKELAEKLSSIMNYVICKSIKNNKVVIGLNSMRDNWDLLNIHNDILWCFKNNKFNNLSFTNVSSNSNSNKFDFAHYSKYAKAVLTSVKSEAERFALTAIPKQIYYNQLKDINKSVSELILFNLDDGKGYRNSNLLEILNSYQDLTYYSKLTDKNNNISSVTKSYVEKYPITSRYSKYTIKKNSIIETTIPKQKIEIKNLTIPKSSNVYPNFLEIIMKNNSSRFIEMFYNFIKQTNQYSCTHKYLSNINNDKSIFNVNGIQNLDHGYIYSCKMHSLLQFNKVCNLLIKKDFKNAKIELMKIFGNEKNKICYDYIINSGFGINLLDYISNYYFENKKDGIAEFLSNIEKDYRFFPDDSSLTNYNITKIEGNSIYEILYRLKSDSSLKNFRFYESLSKNQLTNNYDKLPETSSIKYYESFINQITDDNLENFTLANRYICEKSATNQIITKNIKIRYPICIKNSKTNEFNIKTDYYLNGMRAEINRNPCYVQSYKDKKYNDSDLPKQKISQAAMVRFYYYWYMINKQKVVQNLENYFDSINLSNDYFSANFYVDRTGLQIPDKDKFILNGDPFTTKNQKVYVVRQRIKSLGNVPTNVNRSLLYSEIDD